MEHQGQQNIGQRGEENTLPFLIKKAEKLTTALYMVSDIISDKDPMKWTLREAGVEVLSDIALAHGASSSDRMSAIRETLRKVEKVIALLDLAHSTKVVSEMNSSVLRREYIALKDGLENEWTNVNQGGKEILRGGFFDVSRILTAPLGRDTRDSRDGVRKEDAPRPLVREERAPEVRPNVAQKENEQIRTDGERPNFVRPNQERTQNQNQHQNPNRYQHPNQNQDRHNIRQEIPPKNNALASALAPFLPSQAKMAEVERATPPLHQGQQMRAPEIRTEMRPERELPRPAERPALPPREPRRELADHNSPGRGDAARDDRRKIIMALAKQKPAIQVTDVSRSIPGVSEKTIQRELLAMVAEGILVKHGERRWSTYSLPS